MKLIPQPSSHLHLEVVAHLVKLDALVGDEDDLIPCGPAEAQDVGVLHLEQKNHINKTNNKAPSEQALQLPARRQKKKSECVPYTPGRTRCEGSRG